MLIRKLFIGDTLDQLNQLQKARMLELLGQYQQDNNRVDLLKQCVDFPHKTRARISLWQSNFNAKHGPGSAGPFLQNCLSISGSSKTVADVDNEAAALEAQMQVLVDNVNNNGWTWPQVAAEVQNAISLDPEEPLTFESLPMPDDYVSVWGDPW